MKPKHLFFIIMVVVSLLVAGCTSTNPVSSTNTVTTTMEFTQVLTPVTGTSTHPWTCIDYGTRVPIGSGIYVGGDAPSPFYYDEYGLTPVYNAFPSPEPTPPYNGGTMQNDPIIGTYIFDPSQFKTLDVEDLKYFSGETIDFYYSVPLDISQDIKWTFRDDGILLFFQNNITCSDNSLRRFWRNSSGDFLRNATWKRIETDKDVIKYQIKWGCFGQPSHEYIVTYDKNGVRLTQPNSLNMTKIS